MTSNLYNLIEADDNIDIRVLESLPNVINLEDLNSSFSSANIEEHEAIATIIVGIHDNNARFATDNPNYRNYSQTELESIFSTEIDIQLNKVYGGAAGSILMKQSTFGKDHLYKAHERFVW